MTRIRFECAILLAMALLVFGANDFLHFYPALHVPSASPGWQVLELMRIRGLLLGLALSQLAIGLMLLFPRTRFAGSLLQLPISLGLVGFHATMLPQGLGATVFLLLLNTVVFADPAKLRGLSRGFEFAPAAP